MRVTIARPLACLRVAVTLLTLAPLAFVFLALVPRIEEHPEVRELFAVLGVGVGFGLATLVAAIARPRWNFLIGLVNFGGLGCITLVSLISEAQAAPVWLYLALTVMGSVLALVPEGRGYHFSPGA